MKLALVLLVSLTVAYANPSYRYNYPRYRRFIGPFASKGNGGGGGGGYGGGGGGGPMMGGGGGGYGGGGNRFQPY